MEVVEGRWFHFRARGHPNVTALHRTTLEITKENWLTKRGDCIVGVSSEASVADLPSWLKDAIRGGATVVVVLCAGDVCDSVVGRGDPGLELSDPRRMILRRSTYKEPATLMISSSKAAGDLDRRLVSRLSSGAQLDVFVTALPRQSSPAHGIASV